MRNIFSEYSSQELQSALRSKLFRDMLDAMPIAIAVMEPLKNHGVNDGFTYVFTNRAADSLAGRPLEAQKLYISDDTLLFNSISEVMNSGKADDFVYHYQNEPEKWIHYTITKFDAGVLLAYENITERRKASIAYEHQKQLMDAAQAISHTGSFEWDLAENKIYWSDEMYRIHGMKPQEIEVSKEITLGLVHPADQGRINKKIEFYAKTPGAEEIQFKLRLADGSTRHVSARFESFRGKSGKVNRIAGLVHDITEKRLKAEELRDMASEFEKQCKGKEKREATLEDYRRIIENSSSAIVSVDKKGIITTWNRAAETLYGYSAAEAIGRQIGKLLVPEHNREIVAGIFANLFEGNPVADFETVKTCRGGKPIEVAVNLVPMKGANGKINGIVITSRNISHENATPVEIKPRNSWLSDAEEFIEKITTTVPDIIQIHDIESNSLVYTNQGNNSLLKKFGLADDPMKMTDIERAKAVVHPDDFEKVFQYIADRKNISGDEIIEVELKMNNGGYTRSRSKVFKRDANGKPTQILIVTSDITEQKKSQELEMEGKLKLTEQAQFIQGIANASADILYVMNLNSKEIVYTNHPIAELLGYGSSEIKKMQNPVLSIMHDADVPRMLTHLEEMKLASDDEVREIEYRMKHADGNLIWFRDRNTVFKRDANGTPTEKLGICQNINEPKLAEENIRQLNRTLRDKNRELQSLNNEMKTFTSIAASDYKETLTTLYTNLEFIISRDAQNLSNTGKANLRKAQTSIQKMKLLTDDIVAFSKLQDLDSNPSMVNLNTVLGSAVDELKEKLESIEAEIESDDLPTVKGFPVLIDLMFFHLLSNAVKFRRGEEKLHIKVAYHVTKDKLLGTDMHQISFIDNGIGIASDQTKKVFEMFYRNDDKKYRGSGIGLAICKKIADLHGGTMAIESELGKGTTVCCFFPIS